MELGLRRIRLLVVATAEARLAEEVVHCLDPLQEMGLVEKDSPYTALDQSMSIVRQDAQRVKDEGGKLVHKRSSAAAVPASVYNLSLPRRSSVN